MIICDAAMILFTFDLNHSQNFRPHRKKKKNLHPHTASGGALTLRRIMISSPDYLPRAGTSSLLGPVSFVEAPVLCHLVPWLNSEWIYTPGTTANIQACRRSNVLLNLHPLPNPSPPPRTQQNMNHPHTCSLVTANKQPKRRTRNSGHR